MLYILKCDSLVPEIVAKQGDYGEIYTARLRSAGYKVETKTFDVIEGEYPESISDQDAIMISGSKRNAWEDEPWILKLVEFVNSNLGKVPIFGVCFGHQIIGRTLGAKVGPSDKSWEASAAPVQLSPLAEQLFPNLGDHPVFMHMHKDQVFEVPKNTELLFSTEITPVQGFYRKNEVLSVQFHPEFDEMIVTEICTNRFTGEFQADALARAKKPQNGVDFLVYASDFLNRKL